VNTPPKPPLQMPPRDLSQRPEVHRNVWYATVSRMEDAGEHWRRRRPCSRIGIAGERHWTDWFTLRRAAIALVAVVAVAAVFSIVLGMCG
jgi:hypothetical protein